MRNGARIAVVIPALNEEASIGKVLDAIPEWVDQIVVADNGSKDTTREIAAERGARVVDAPRRGYGSACLCGIAALDPCDIVVFVDGDYSDYPNQMSRLVDPIVQDRADLVIGSRRLGNAERGSLTLQQRAGNALACVLIRSLWGVPFTDLGPFRAIRYDTLNAIGMQDPDYGWTVEMQIKAAVFGIRSLEVPVDYRRRIGKSKISGTVRGVAAAGYKILSTIALSAFRYYIWPSRRIPRRRLIIFTRFPVPGVTKTRMIAALGEKGAADLQRAMTEHAVRNARSLMHVDIEVRFAGGTLDGVRNWLGPGLSYSEQGEGDLGTRMRRAFESAFAHGFSQAVVVGTDCPDLSPGVMKSAFDALARGRLVLGPALDGGYYLIGLSSRDARSTLPFILSGIDWGTASVFDQTIERATERGIVVERLVLLRDVDREEDLEVWERSRPGADRPELSIVIPTLNEEYSLPGTLASVAQLEGVELIVVDGGSTDETTNIAGRAEARIVRSSRGRAAQMDTGAANASGRSILFLHADTIAPAGFKSEIERVLSDNRTSLGAFRFTLDDSRLSMRWIALWAGVRSRLFGMPYGDQGYFLRLDVFRAIGGFANLPIMEDYALVRKAARVGRIRTSTLPAVTSSRRWRRLGPWRAVMYNQIVVAGFWLGVNPERLAAYYRSRRSRHDA